MNTNKVIVALSGDETQEMIIKKAIHIVKDNPNTTLVFVHVVSTPLFDFLDFKNAVNPESIKEELTNVIQKFKPKSKVIVSVEFGKAAGVILDLAKKYNADLVVMGAKASQKEEMAWGSTTKQILNAAQVPVLVVKNPHLYEDKYLVLVDLVGPACKPKEFVRDKFVKGYTKDYIFVYTVPDELSMRYHDIDTTEFHHWEEKARALIAKHKEEFEAEHPGVEVKTLENKGGVAPGVKTYAKEHGFHLVALDSREIQGNNSIIFDSTASSVVKMVDADLLIGFCD